MVNEINAFGSHYKVRWSYGFEVTKGHQQGRVLPQVKRQIMGVLGENIDPH